ncbi:hypothetical protein LTR10_000308 [Elasticomyces elasticus]|nr:hypothetical protein LTR10_000308 [Elasticomyces elasticus]KAK4980437.1 hypothetical protein LTR42_000744 [Elasticomyces elasticus]
MGRKPSLRKLALGQTSPKSSLSSPTSPHASTEKVAPADLERQATVQEGEQKFHRLSWQSLTVCLIVEGIALGSLSLPAAFAAVGMVAGVLLCVGIGLIAIYTSYVVGQVFIKHPDVRHYPDAMRLLGGRPLELLGNVMLPLFLVLIVGSHVLTGTIAFISIADKPVMCALGWGAISAAVLFAVALPPTFHDLAFLGYIDFCSILIAIGITMVTTGVQAHSGPGGLAAVEWSVWPPADMSFYKAFLATTNIVFAYSFAVCQFSFMVELHTPKDYVKSIWALGLIEIVIYTVVGAVIYAFVGQHVESPALLSAGHTVKRIAFGVALPVIFISGSINTTVLARLIIDRAFKDSEIRFVNSKAGWLVWIALVAVITVLSWVVAEAIPFFSALLGLISSLFISGFSFYFPALFWFRLIKKGKWNASRHNVCLSIVNAVVLVIGVAILGCGTYASVMEIVTQYQSGSVRGSFTCDNSSYMK